MEASPPRGASVRRGCDHVDHAQLLAPAVDQGLDPVFAGVVPAGAVLAETDGPAQGCPAMHVEFRPRKTFWEVEPLALTKCTTMSASTRPWPVNVTSKGSELPMAMRCGNSACALTELVE